MHATSAAATPLTDPGRASWKQRAKGFLVLTKPRIVELLLITTVPTMILAAGGWPGETFLRGLWLVLATVIGGALAAGSANTYNMWYDRDIDAVMNRTKKRPLVTGLITPAESLIFASVLAVVSVLWLGLTVNWLAAGLAFAANVMYSVGYTVLLKRHTKQNIVWGGSAGAMPVLIGWAAVTGSLSWAPVLLFGIIFFWTPPHYWPLSMRFKSDYANAKVPMLPVSEPAPLVASHMLVYTAAMVAASLVLIPVAGLGWLYSAVAVVTGGWFTYLCVQLWRRAKNEEKLAAMKVFHGSITYLSVLFIAMAIDPFLPF